MSCSIAIIGTTRWGTTLALMLARGGHRVLLWARTSEEAAALEHDRENRVRLPGFPFPADLHATADLAYACDGAALCIIAVPSQTFRENVRRLKGVLAPQTLVLSATKGLEQGTGLRMSEIAREELALPPERVAVLSGPNLSREIAQGVPAASVVAGCAEESVHFIQATLMGPTYRVYTSDDPVGVEFGGALKNVIALAAGMGDALGYGANARAALITRGLAEMARLGVAYGAQPLTFSGLAGMGDLVATCTSPLSRNWQVGYHLGKGLSLDAAMAAAEGTAEGVFTAPVALELARRASVEVPIIEQVCQTLSSGKDPRLAVEELMGRAPKAELAGIPMQGG